MVSLCELLIIRERQLHQKANRKLEKRMKEVVMQLDDERRTIEQYKEQVEKVCVTNPIKDVATTCINFYFLE